MKIQRFIFNAGLLALLLFLGASCRHNRNHPGYVYMPDMNYSEAAEPYTANAAFADSLTMRVPVKGTIPRGFIPYPYQAKSADDQKRAGLELVNPTDSSAQTLARGKERFDIFCASCHGLQGKGDGHLYTSKLFTAKPTSLVDDFVQSKPDGEIYHVITLGSLSGLMGAHGSQIPADDRWKIVKYVRELAKK